MQRKLLSANAKSLRWCVRPKFMTHCLFAYFRKNFRQGVAPRHILILLMLLSESVAGVVCAEVQSDSLPSRWDALMNWNFMALPYPSYAPETSWTFGVAGVGYFRSHKNNTDYGNIKFNAEYTLHNQWLANVSGRVSLKDSRLRYIDYSLAAKHYPDRFYGIGNDRNAILDKPLDYTHSSVELSAKPAFVIANHWEAGPTLQLGYNNIPASASIDSLLDVYSADGVGSRFHIAPGGMILYDSRDNRFYPNRGMLFKVSASLVWQFGCYQRLFGDLTLDFRHFVPLYKNFIFAYHFKTQAVVGDAIPFYMLPTVGGQDILRGVIGNKYRDNLMMALQCEFRIPIWRFVKAAVFGAVGDVYNTEKFRFAIPKYGYGAGLRLSLHKVGTTVRFDAAWQDNIKSPNFYFTIEEAF